MNRKATNTKGKPDFEIYGPRGLTCHVEFKVPPNKLRPEQEQFIASLRASGHAALVTSELRFAIDLVKREFAMG
jgi:hypothetical protein